MTTQKELVAALLLKTVARERIESGSLPRTLPVRTWGGHGANRPCSLCQQVIELDEVELEIEIEDGFDGTEKFIFHSACKSAWQLECDEYLRRLRAQL